MRSIRILLAGALAWGAPALSAQGGELAARCATPGVPAECYTVAQALASAQPQLGILVAGGNPTPGATSAGGLRLGRLPGVSASLGVNIVVIKLPDILGEQTGSGSPRRGETVGIPAPALSGVVTIALFPGFRMTPSIGGVGSVDAIAAASWLPLSALHSEGFRTGGAEFAYGAGVRIGVMRESFVTPGVSVSVIRRRLGEIGYGDICPGNDPSSTRGESLVSTRCGVDGDPGEFAADLDDWSTRAVIGKRLLGMGVAAGLGYDHFSSDVRFGVRASDGTPAPQPNAFRVTGVDLAARRWSGFLGTSFTLLVTTLAAEAGWLQGGAEMQGFPETSDFDPGAGAFFGRAGVRIAL